MYLTIEDTIEKTKPPIELNKWVFNALNKLHLKEEKLLLKTYPQVKIFIYPLAIFCDNYFSEYKSIKLQQIVGSQPYHVLVIDCGDFNYIKATNQINGHDDIIQECKQVILKKVKNKTETCYSQNAILIVSFDDTLFRPEKDIDEMKLFMLNQLNPIIADFSGLALVGSTGKVFCGFLKRRD